jgi:superfamily I DNA and/or RNA helicase
MFNFISEFISKNVYDGRLMDGKMDHRKDRIEWIDVKGREDSSKKSIINNIEAQKIVSVVEMVLKSGIKCGDLVILTGYDGQRNHIAKELKLKFDKGHQIFKDSNERGILIR